METGNTLLYLPWGNLKHGFKVKRTTILVFKVIIHKSKVV